MALNKKITELRVFALEQAMIFLHNSGETSEAVIEISEKFYAFLTTIPKNPSKKRGPKPIIKIIKKKTTTKKKKSPIMTESSIIASAN